MQMSKEQECVVCFNQQIHLNELHAAFTSNQAATEQIVHEFSGTVSRNQPLQVLFPALISCFNSC